jgi:hypothetical protein
VTDTISDNVTAQRLSEHFTLEFWEQIDTHRALGVMDEATYRAVVGCYDPCDRKRYLMLLHPDESPDLIGPGYGCVNPPSRFRSNAKWRNFRDTCVVPMIEACQDDPNWPLRLSQIEKLLMWRASIPVEDRFWRPDPENV